MFSLVIPKDYSELATGMARVSQNVSDLRDREVIIIHPDGELMTGLAMAYQTYGKNLSFITSATAFNHGVTEAFVLDIMDEDQSDVSFHLSHICRMENCELHNIRTISYKLFNGVYTIQVEFNS